MLEGLFSQLAKPTPPIIKVPPVPSHKTQREPLQATNGGAVPSVPPVPSQKTKVDLSETDRQKILFYLDSIGETDQDIINDLLTECGRNPNALAWALSWTDRAPVNQQPLQQVVTCRNCSHFKSFNAHGGGAGTCGAGVWTASNCLWGATERRCETYKTKA